jgi:hypothetical protein
MLRNSMTLEPSRLIHMEARMDPTQVAGYCGEEDECPKTLVTEQEAYFQGRLVTDPAILAKTRPGEGEAVVATPLEQLFEAALLAAPLIRQKAGEVDTGGGRGLFDVFTHAVFRLETRQVYVVDQERERLSAFREGRPLPERSIRTSSWVRRMALSTIDGKEWSRVRIVEYPLTEYTRFELLSYIDHAMVGQIAYIADRAPALTGLDQDFWLFDGDTGHPVARLMHYDTEGRFLGSETTTDAAIVERCKQQRDLARAHAVPLNQFLAEKAGMIHP